MFTKAELYYSFYENDEKDARVCNRKNGVEPNFLFSLACMCIELLDWLLYALSKTLMLP
jgi:hypothetical protein